MKDIYTTPNILIDGTEISENSSPYIIAELSANHNGSIDKAFKIIKAAKESEQMQLNFRHIQLIQSL